MLMLCDTNCAMNERCDGKVTTHFVKFSLGTSFAVTTKAAHL